MRRLALAALSVQLLSAPLANAGEPLPAGPAWLPTQEVSVSADWGPTAGTTGTDKPRPASDIQPDWRPNAPVTAPGLLAAQPVRASQLPPEDPGEITVLAGDTLWDIAARELGAAATDLDIALQWPRWYQANQAVIGENPNVLLPGQILKSPSAA
jgi:nucleoid-associated protein YgaU